MNKQIKIILIAMWVLVGVAVGGVVAGVLWYRASQPEVSVNMNPNPMPMDINGVGHRLDPMYNAPAFTLTDQAGQKFGSDQLHGKVWVADFVFTTCTGLCPMMTQQMSEFQKQTAGSNIQMVSFSVDPEHDTPAVLTSYARDARADLSRWHFLTGDKETLWKISTAMKLAVGPGDGTDHQVMHSSHFLLVDGNGAVRGVYDYKDPGFMAQLVNDAKSLNK
jgi:protein SCO1/2